MPAILCLYLTPKQVISAVRISTPPSKSLATLGAQAACQSIDKHFGILTVHDNHELGLFCHHKLIYVHELCV